MKLERKEIKVQSSFNSSVSFGMKDPSVIFEILCNRLYENPLRILVQEYMCNARDSHREAKCTDIPIKITLPTRLNPVLMIEDTGVGISPERMNNVFIFLGESTKDGDDNQTGGFGVGAKVAWAYTDSFTITTRFDGIEYTYLAYIGDAGIGQLNLINQEDTHKPNGTIISVDIKPKDISKVEEYVSFTGHFWEVQPEVFRYDENVSEKMFNVYKQHAINEHAIILDAGATNDYIGFNGGINVVVDGIIYRQIESKLADEFVQFKISSNQEMFLFFNTGELTLAINRENVQFNDHSLNAIKRRVKKIITYINNEIDNFFKKHNTITDAIKDADNIKGLFQFIKSKTVTIDSISYQVSLHGNKLSTVYDFGNGASITTHELNSKNQLRKDRYNKTNQLTISESLFDDKSIIFNDKFTTGLNNVAIKNHMFRTGLNKVTIISGSYGEDMFMQHHGKIISLLHNLVKLSSLNEGRAPSTGKRVKREKYPCNVYRLAYSTNRYRDEKAVYERRNILDLLEEGFTPICFEYNQISPYTMREKIKFVEAYNEAYDTNCVVVVALKRSQIYLKSIDAYLPYFNWYREVAEKMVNDIPTDYAMKKESRMLDRDSRIGSIQFMNSEHSHILDKNILKYIEEVGKLAKYKERAEKSHSNVSLMKLYNLVISDYTYNEAISNSWKLKTIKSLFKRKNKRVKNLKRYITRTYPLIEKVVSGTSSHDVIEYINAKYKMAMEI